MRRVIELMTQPTVSIKDVSAKAGVSPGTVSNVLNSPERVAVATRIRVQAVIDDLGYVRNGFARRLRSSHNNALGMVVIDVGNQFFTSMVRGAERTAEQRGYMVTLCDADSSPARELRHLQVLEEQRVAGVLITPISTVSVGSALEMLHRRGIKVVLVDEPTTDPTRCSVSVDDVNGGELVGRHLLALGRRRIAFVTTIRAFRQFEERLAGLQQAVATHAANGDGEAEITVWRVPNLDSGAASAVIGELTSAGVDAVFCSNDVAAVDVLRGLLAQGIRVPEDIAVVGYDDVALASLVAVPLTSVRQPAQLLGSTAAKLMIEELEHGDHQHQHIVFQPELIVRQSTIGAPQAPDR